MKRNIPPSIREQQWGLIVGLFLSLVVISQSMQIIIFWPTKKWSPFIGHITYLSKCFWMYFTQHSWGYLERYFNTLATVGILNEMLLAAAVSLFISFLLAFIVTKKCYGSQEVGWN